MTIKPISNSYNVDIKIASNSGIMSSVKASGQGSFNFIKDNDELQTQIISNDFINSGLNLTNVNQTINETILQENPLDSKILEILDCSPNTKIIFAGALCISHLPKVQVAKNNLIFDIKNKILSKLAKIRE
jgi:hypothetical protein